eukprot:1350161-Prymnesium_polylepis.1
MGLPTSCASIAALRRTCSTLLCSMNTRWSIAASRLDPHVLTPQCSAMQQTRHRHRRRPSQSQRRRCMLSARAIIAS